MMMLKPAHLLLALIAAASAPAFAADKAEKVESVATVNGKPISKAKVDQLVKQATESGNQTEAAQLRELAKNELISREVLFQEADKQGFGLRPDVKAELETTRQNVVINAMFIEFTKKNPVADAEIKSEYDKYKAQVDASGAKEVHARHILVATEDEAKALIVKLKGGAKFEELAKASKDTGSGANGGDLGWSNPNKYVKPFADAVSALKKGELTETPVKSDFGFHVIRLEDSRAVTVPPLEQVKGQVADQLRQRKLQAFRDELMKKAKIQ
jgi:peptidyl-prolyl cis-trans isomerase C